MDILHMDDKQTTNNIERPPESLSNVDIKGDGSDYESQENEIDIPSDIVEKALDVISEGEAHLIEEDTSERELKKIELSPIESYFNDLFSRSKKKSFYKNLKNYFYLDFEARKKVVSSLLTHSIIDAEEGIKTKDVQTELLYYLNEFIIYESDEQFSDFLYYLSEKLAYYNTQGESK